MDTQAVAIYAWGRGLPIIAATFLCYLIKDVYVTRGKVRPDIAHYDIRAMVSLVMALSPFILSREWSWFSPRFWNCETNLLVNRWLSLWFVLQWGRYIFEITDSDSRSSVIGTTLRRLHVVIAAVLGAVWGTIGVPLPGTFMGLLIMYEFTEFLVDTGVSLGLREKWVFHRIVINGAWVLIRIVFTIVAIYQGSLGRGIVRVLLGVVAVDQILLFLALPRR